MYEIGLEIADFLGCPYFPSIIALWIYRKYMWLTVRYLLFFVGIRERFPTERADPNYVCLVQQDGAAHDHLESSLGNGCIVCLRLVSVQS